jgi:hypothetical protein
MFYQPPFISKHAQLRVYDNKGDFAFQFFEVNEEMRNSVINSLNTVEHLPIEGEFTINENKPTYIYRDNVPFILIRGWGNLTGTGGHNFDHEKAAKIQDELRDWIISKLSKKQ